MIERLGISNQQFDASDPRSPYYCQPAMYLPNDMDMGAYTGPTNNGMREGNGKCVWADGSSYEGDWAQNKRHGNGVFITSDGHKYEG